MWPLVSRSISQANASAVDLTLTAEGVATVQRVTASREGVLRAALAGIDPGTASATAVELERIIDRIDEEVRS